MRTAEDSLAKSNNALMVFEDVFTRVFEMVANVIEKQKPFLDKVYGSGKIMRLIQRLQRETDVQTCIMIDTFLDKKQVQRKLVEIKDSHSDPNLVDTREVDLILTEITLLSSKTQLFEAFLTRRTKVNFIIILILFKD